jgi:hypothetical protein
VLSPCLGKHIQVAMFGGCVVYKMCNNACAYLSFIELRDYTGGNGVRIGKAYRGRVHT